MRNHPGSALPGVGPKVRQHFIEQMFSGMNQINLSSQIVRRHRSAQFDLKTPMTFVKDNEWNQFCPMANSESHRADGHLKCPTLPDRHIHLLACAMINGDQQRIPGRKKLAHFAQLIQIEGRRNLAKRRKSVSQPLEFRSLLSFSGYQSRGWNADGPEPKSG